MAVLTSATELETLLKRNGHRVTISGAFWLIDNKLSYWPLSGKYRQCRSIGGNAGSLRGSAESNVYQIERLLKEIA